MADFNNYEKENRHLMAERTGFSVDKGWREYVLRVQLSAEEHSYFVSLVGVL